MLCSTYMALLSNQDHEDRPWGFFDRFTLNEKSTVKVLKLKPHERLSLQTHAKRSEFWHVISGEGIATIGGQDMKASAGSNFDIEIGVAHRLTAGDTELVWLEVALGEFEEHDEVRVEDDFGRSSPGA